MSACVVLTILGLAILLWRDYFQTIGSGGDEVRTTQWGILNYCETTTHWEDGVVVEHQSDLHQALLILTSALSVVILTLFASALVALHRGRLDGPHHSA